MCGKKNEKVKKNGKIRIVNEHQITNCRNTFYKLKLQRVEIQFNMN